MMGGRLGLACYLVVATAACRISFDSQYDHAWRVSVTQDRLAGPTTMTSPAELAPGTVGLSLREALTIAANTPDADLIEFERTQLTSPIVLTSPLPAITSPNTAIDTYGAAIAIDARLAVPVIDIRADGCAVRGLLFTAPAAPAISARLVRDVELANNEVLAPAGTAIELLDTTDAIVEGNRIVGPIGPMTIGPDMVPVIVVNRAVGGAIRDNQLDDLAWEGIRIDGSRGVSVTGNRIVHAEANLLSAYDSTDLAIESNFLDLGQKASKFGIHLERVSDSRIVSNLVDPGNVRLINLQDSARNHIEGNIVDRGSAGIALFGASDDNLIFRNVSVGQQYDGIYIEPPAQNNRIIHNTILACPSPLSIGGTNNLEQNNLVTDEQLDFVDAAAYDFHLIAGSVHVDAAPFLGYDLVPTGPETYWGARPDVGAVETR